MFIKRSRKRVNNKVYEYGHLVASHNTLKGPRHEILYSLGKIDYVAPELDKELADKLARVISGQLSLVREDPLLERICASMKPTRRRAKEAAGDADARRENAWEENPVVTAVEAGSPTDETTECVDAEIVRDEIVHTGTSIQTVTPKWIKAHTEAIEFTNARAAGPVWVGHNIWKMLGMDSILREQNFSDSEIHLTEILALNRLIEPTSEYSTPDWVARTALSDILDKDVDDLNYRKLYGHLDRLHEKRKPIESQLFAREANLFNLDTSIYLYDLTSTYFEGQCASNESAKHGYSRDKRSDCRQIVVGLMLNRDGFPIGHEIFDGNTVDCQTVEIMMDTLAERTGVKEGLTITVDRGMSDQKNLELIRSRKHHYIVAAKQTERKKWLDEFESIEGWHEIIRSPELDNPRSVPTGVQVKLFERGDEVFVLCLSAGRVLKDRAIRERQEKKFLADLEKLKKRVGTGSMKTAKKIYEAVGRIRERYSRVGRYYEIDFDDKTDSLSWHQDSEKKRHAEQVDGGYILRTSRKDLTDEEIWRTYMLLTRVEAAFRDMKSPLSMRPIFHQLKQRAEAHVFVCVLSYHLLVSIERLLRKAGISYSWETVRKKLSTHQVVSGILRSSDGRAMEVRKDTTATPEQRSIYEALGIPCQVLPVSKTRWVNS